MNRRVWEMLVKPPAATEEVVAAFARPSSAQREKWDGGKKLGIEWHRKSHHFVCVFMSSGARDMVGGERDEALMYGWADGRMVKVGAPQMVHVPFTFP